MAVEISADKITYDGVNIFDLIYPVGSIYISVNNVNPKTLFGGEWEMLPEGYALWTATSDAGSTIAAGLPNITGSATNDKGAGLISNSPISLAITSGAFFSDTSFLKPYTSSSKNYDGCALGFDASKSNSIYGNSSTVQPPAYKLYVWKRIPEVS